MQKPTDLMLCAEVQENLYDYFTGRVSPVLHETIRQHLRDCAACRKVFEKLKITLGLLDQIKPATVSDDFTERVMRSLEPKVIPFRRRPMFRYVMQGAVAAMLVLGMVSLFKLYRPGTSDVSTVRGPGQPAVTDTCRTAIELYNKGTANADLKQKESLLQQALAKPCTDNKVLARIHNNLADFYEQQGRLDEALAGYTKASELDPQLYTACLGLGDIYIKMGKREEALRFYEKAVALMEAETLKGNIERDDIDKTLRTIKGLKEKQ